MSNTKADRKHRRQRWAENHRAVVGGVVATDTAGGDTAATELPHSDSGVVAHKIEEASAFMPEFMYDENQARLRSVGQGEVLDRARHRWLEIQAVKERYPVSRGMLNRVAFEVMRTLESPSTATRDKMIASKLIITMAEGNHVKGLPEQMQPTTINNVTNIGLSVGEFVRGIHNDRTAIDAMDFREFKPTDGSVDDYAE